MQIDVNTYNEILARLVTGSNDAARRVGTALMSQGIISGRMTYAERAFACAEHNLTWPRIVAISA